MVWRQRGLPLHEEHVLLGPACSNILVLSRHILLPEACAICDFGLRCKCDGNVGKDVWPVSAHPDRSEPGRSEWQTLGEMEVGFLLRLVPPCWQEEGASQDMVE